MKLFLAILMTLGSALSFAQFNASSMFDMTMRPYVVLQRPDIRKELKVSKDQAKQMDEITKAFNKSAQTGGLGTMDMLTKADADLLAVLEPVQKQRYSELNIQIRGATALSDVEVAKTLELTEEQSASVKKIRAAAIDKVLEGARTRGGKMDKIMEETSKAEEKDLLALLTETQREAFKKMAGVTFKGARPKGSWPL